MTKAWWDWRSWPLDHHGQVIWFYCLRQGVCLKECCFQSYNCLLWWFWKKDCLELNVCSEWRSAHSSSGDWVLLMGLLFYNISSWILSNFSCVTFWREVFILPIIPSHYHFVWGLTCINSLPWLGLGINGALPVTLSCAGVFVAECCLRLQGWVCRVSDQHRIREPI